MEKICTELAADERFKEGPVISVQSIDPTNLVLRVKGLAESSHAMGLRDMWKRIMNKTLK